MARVYVFAVTPVLLEEEQPYRDWFGPLHDTEPPLPQYVR